MMKSILEAIYNSPQWVQPRASQNRFEMRSAESLFADLEFPKWYGSLAIATAAEERWTFKRVGFFNPRITVRSEGSETDLAVFRPKWTGNEGTAQLANGATYTWKAANFWATEYAWQNAAGETLILYKQGVEDSWLADLFKTQARVEIQPSAQGLQDLALLVILGWYLIVLKQQDDAGVAATAAIG
jgi:hypothetical protein